MKAYTDIEQSKRLMEFLPLKSADIYYPYFVDNKWGETARFGEALEYSGKKDIPCWSLAALLNLIPQVKLDSIKQSNEKLWRCLSYFKSEWNESIWYDNPIDACYEMILELNRQKLL